MNYVDYHAGVRRRGERALERRVREHDYERDEPTTVLEVSENAELVEERAPSETPVRDQWITLGGNAAFGWQWAQGIATGQPTPEEREFIARQGWDCQQDANNPAIWFVCDPAAICYYE